MVDVVEELEVVEDEVELLEGVGVEVEVDELELLEDELLDAPGPEVVELVDVPRKEASEGRSNAQEA